MSDWTEPTQNLNSHGAIAPSTHIKSTAKTKTTQTFEPLSALTRFGWAHAEDRLYADAAGATL
jgi:hypothetical protein